VLSFVCSVGNVPLAAVLWAGGISFSGVIAFVYADLIIVPIVLAYRKYYGGAMTFRIVSIMFGTMVAAALAVDGIFSAAGLVPTRRPSIDSITSRGIEWNYTTALNIVFLAFAATLFGLTLRRGARDPMCGMTVDRHRTPRRRPDGVLLRSRLQGEIRRCPRTLMSGYGYDKDALLRRLRRIEGQVRGIERMVEDERYCVDILDQIAAARTALERVGLRLLENHARHCVAGGTADVEELMAAVERFSKVR
jgi:DNA-binding FrmR family transcriptional regulator